MTTTHTVKVEGAKPADTHDEFRVVREKDGKPTKCTFNEGRIEMCWPLQAAVEFPYGQGSRKQGLKIVTLSNMETFEFSRHGIYVVSGEWNKRGVELTFCPFCATVLIPRVAEEITVSIAERVVAKASAS